MSVISVTYQTHSYNSLHKVTDVTSHYEYALVLVRAYNARTESITYFRIGMDGFHPNES